MNHDLGLRVVGLDFEGSPISILAGLFYNVVQPTCGGRWELNRGLTLIF